jgi:Zn ribbon nucleic-acid-binding protein
MSVLRARSACPRCNTEEEVWYYKGSIVPIATSECPRCSYIFQSADFIVSLLDLYQNVTISTNTVSHILT